MAADALFAGPGEVRALCRAMDWSRTAAGAVENWAPSVRMAVRMCLDAPVPMAIWAVPGLGLVYNDLYAALLGPAQHPAALGRSARDVWAGQWQWLGPDLEQVIQRGEATTRPQLRLLLKRDGTTEEEFFLSTSLAPIRDDDGAVVAAVNVMIDITERVRAFAQRTALLEAVIQSSQDAIFAKDLHGRMLLANPTMVGFLGKPAEQILGKTDFEFLPDKAQARQTMANDRRVFETGEPIEAEELVSSEDGTVAVWHAAKALVRDASGRAIGLLGISRNITERKRDNEAVLASEARLREAQRLARMGSWEWVPGAEFTSWSEGLFRILGRDLREGPPSIKTFRRCSRRSPGTAWGRRSSGRRRRGRRTSWSSRWSARTVRGSGPSPAGRRCGGRQARW
jgi:PAS domain S-box-containing protein